MTPRGVGHSTLRNPRSAAKNGASIFEPTEQTWQVTWVIIRDGMIRIILVHKTIIIIATDAPVTPSLSVRVVEWRQVSDHDSRRIVDHSEWLRYRFRHRELPAGT